MELFQRRNTPEISSKYVVLNEIGTFTNEALPPKDDTFEQFCLKKRFSPNLNFISFSNDNSQFSKRLV